MRLWGQKLWRFVFCGVMPHRLVEHCPFRKNSFLYHQDLLKRRCSSITAHNFTYQNTVIFKWTIYEKCTNVFGREGTVWPTATEPRPTMYCAFPAANFHFEQNALSCLSILMVHYLVLKICTLESTAGSPGVADNVPGSIRPAYRNFHWVQKCWPWGYI
jgi:hypothetical protein